MSYLYLFIKEICKIVSWKKICNLFQLIVNYFLASYTKRFNYKRQPFSIAIEPTNICQLECQECPTGMGTSIRPKGFLSLDNFKSIIDQNADYLLNLTFYFQGEPFLYQDICQCIHYATHKNIFVNTSTNGQNIDMNLARQIVNSGLHHIIISLDGKDQKSYSQYRQNGDIEKVLTSIKNLSVAKKAAHTPFPKIVAQCLLLKSTENDLKEIKNIAQQAGADTVVFKTAQFYDLESRKSLLPTKKKYSRYKQNQDGKYECRTSKKVSPPCWRAWTSLVITWDMNVLPCCFDKNAQYAYGNLKQNNLQEILQDKKYLSFQEKACGKLPICHNCTF